MFRYLNPREGTEKAVTCCIKFLSDMFRYLNPHEGTETYPRFLNNSSARFSYLTPREGTETSKEYFDCNFLNVQTPHSLQGAKKAQAIT